MSPRYTDYSIKLALGNYPLASNSGEPVDHRRRSSRRQDDARRARRELTVRKTRPAAPTSSISARHDITIAQLVSRISCIRNLEHLLPLTNRVPRGHHDTLIAQAIIDFHTLRDPCSSNDTAQPYLVTDGKSEINFC